jgi:hypothetical protein
MPSSSTRSNTAEMMGTHTPTPAMSTGGSSKMMKDPHSSPGRARMSPVQRLCSKDSQNLQCPRCIAPTTSCVRSLSARHDSKQRARCLGDASAMPASTPLRCGVSRMCPSIKPCAGGERPVNAPVRGRLGSTASPTSPFMSVDVGVRMRKRLRAKGIYYRSKPTGEQRQAIRGAGRLPGLLVGPGPSVNGSRSGTRPSF